MEGLGDNNHLLEGATPPGHSTAIAVKACTLVHQVHSNARSAFEQQRSKQTMSLWSLLRTCCP